MTVLSLPRLIDLAASQDANHVLARVVDAD